MLVGMQTQDLDGDSFYTFKPYRVFEGNPVILSRVRQRVPDADIELRLWVGAEAYYSTDPTGTGFAVGRDKALALLSDGRLGLANRVVMGNEPNIEWGDFDYAGGALRADVDIQAANAQATMALAGMAAGFHSVVPGFPVGFPAWSPRPSCDGLTERDQVRPHLSVFATQAGLIGGHFQYIDLHGYWNPVWPGKPGWSDEGWRVYGHYGGLRITEALARIKESGLDDLPVYIGECNRELIQDPNLLWQPIPLAWERLAQWVGDDPQKTMYNDQELAFLEYKAWLTHLATRYPQIKGAIWFLYLCADASITFLVLRAAGTPIINLKEVNPMPNGDTFDLVDRDALWSAYLRALSAFPANDKTLAAQGGYNMVLEPNVIDIPGAIVRGREFDVKEYRFLWSLLGIAGVEIDNWGNTLFAKTKEGLPPKA